MQAGDELTKHGTWTVPPLGVWSGILRTQPVGRALEIAQQLEEDGYGAMWFPESDARETFVQLAMILGATERMVGGTAIATIWARDPLAMACAGKTLTEAYPERLLLGLGISHQPLVEGMRGHEYRRPLETMRAYLDAMDRATYSAVPPASPVRRLLSALGPKMLELAAQRTSGTIPYLAPPEHTAISRQAMPPGNLVCPVQAIVYETDRDRAFDIARRAHLGFYMALPNYTNNLKRLGFIEDDFKDGGSDRLVDALTAWGTTDRIVARVQRHFEAGADHVVVQVISDVAEPPLEVWTELAVALKGLGPTG
jgi:probable F420-dependent oxidoreductase